MAQKAQKAEKSEKKDDAPLSCKGCAMWLQFHKDCFYFWEGKKHCTMWIGSMDQKPLE